MLELTILDKLPSPLMAVDLQSSAICYVNSEMETALRIPKKNLIGQPVSALDSLIISADGQTFSQSFSATRSLQHAFPVKLSLPDKNKYLLKFQVSIEDNSVLGICFFQEYYFPKEAGRRERGINLSSETLRDVRSMFNSLIGLSHLILLEEDKTKLTDLHNDLTSVSSSILKSFEVIGNPEVRNLPPVAQKKQQLQGFNLAKSLKKEIASQLSFLREKELHLRFSAFEENIYINATEQEIMGLIHDLLHSAIQASEKGEVRCEVFHRMQGNEEQACIKIVDCGQGLKQSVFECIEQPGKISSEDVDTIPGDLLALIQRGKNVARYYGGEMIFESQYGIGNSVSFILPLSTKPETPPEPVKELSEPDDLPALLIVDDDSIVHQIIKKYLQNLCRIESAMDGRRAIAAVTKTHFDIIFLDINLGVGLTGLQVAKQIRRLPEYERTPIVAITAYAMPGDKERAYSAGCDFYQSKPFSRDDIINLFDKCIVGLAPRNYEPQD